MLLIPSFVLCVHVVLGSVAYNHTVHSCGV